jgi:hypothetical protein
LLNDTALQVGSALSTAPHHTTFQSSLHSPILDKTLLQKSARDFASLAVMLSLPIFNSRVARAVGYEAAPSAFSPSKYLYTVPFLPQSALLNSLPFGNELVAELQAYLESFVQLINPTDTQENQIEKNDSMLWTNLRVNAQRAAGTCLVATAPCHFA